MDHTPTPWNWAPTGSVMRGYSQPIAIAQNDHQNLIAGCFGDVKGGEDVCRANAKFIIKAVNNHDRLLAALKETIEPWNDLDDTELRRREERSNRVTEVADAVRVLAVRKLIAEIERP